MPRNRRFATLRELIALVIVAAFVAGVVVIALRADARSSVRSQTNDGGAWLVNREHGVIGQVNRASMEISGVAEVSDDGRGFDVEQKGQIVLVNDVGNGELDLVDPRTYTITNSVAAVDDAKAMAVDGGGVVWTESPLVIWHLTEDQLSGLQSLEEVEPLVRSEGDGLVTVTRDDEVIALDRGNDRLLRFDATVDEGLEPEVVAVPLLERSDRISGLSASGRDAVLLDDGGLAVLPAEATDEEAVQLAFRTVMSVEGGTEGLLLAQPTDAGAELVAVRPDGALLAAPATPPEPATDGEAGGGEGDGNSGDETPEWTPTEISTLEAAEPTAPIVHQGCVFALAREPAVLTRTCGGEEDLREDLDDFAGLDAASLRLKLVNGWVWVNDLATGALLVVGANGRAERLDDWGIALGENDDRDPNDSPDGKKRTDQELDPVFNDDLDEIDEDGQNDPPIAQDDAAKTRVDTPVVVPVLDNDTDPDGDVILVTKLDDVPPGIQVAATADHTAIQMIPPAGATGEYEFSYTITDGRPAPGGGPSADTATVTVEVLDADGANSAPITKPDRVEVAGGSSASVNVLRNDVDPESDAMLLDDVEAQEGQLTFDPSGQVTYSPPPNTTEGEVTLPYVVRDVYGETAGGEIEVKIRPRDSNNEPLAENDSRVGVVDRPMTFNVLANDSDPDSDPLSIGNALELVSGPDGALEQTALSPDGELFFSPERAGEHVFQYTASDGEEQDAGLIRVDVATESDNHAPTAVRDDTTIARGGSRIVYVLQNDTDLDGDVVAIESWERSEGVRVEETRGSGLNIKVLPGAPDLVRLRYSVTDGQSDPVSGTVVVAVSDEAIADQPPIAKPDPIDVRPGRTAGARVLLNDYDPEGGALSVVRPAPTPNAEVRLGPGGQEIFVTPNEDVFTSFTFGYDVVDDAGNRASSYVLVRPVPKRQDNRAPIARPDEARARAGTEATIGAVRNDSDPDGDAIRIESIAAQPLFGEAKVNRDGTITYRSSPDAQGSDRFEYLLVDAEGDKAIGVVLVGVLPADAQNRPPTATDDRFSLIAGSDPLVLDLLGNDFDPNGDQLAIIEVTDGRGLVSFDQESGDVTFSPPQRVEGGSRDVTFEYTLGDGRGETDEATVTVTVTNKTKNISPIAVSDIVGPVLEGDTVRYSVLDNDTDPDGSRADLEVSTKDRDLAIRDGGEVEIRAGEESSEYVYTITDADGLKSTAVITVITTPNRPPVTEPVVIETKFETAVEIDVDEYVADPDGDRLTYACCQNVRKGSTSVSRSDGGRLVVEFDPNDGFDGEAGFAYKVSDGDGGHQVSGAIIVRVKPPENRPPTAEDGAAEVEAGTVGPVALDQWVNDPDLSSGDRLSFELGGAGGAPVTLQGDTMRVAPPIEAAGDVYEIGYRVTDSRGESAEAVVVVTVTESTIPPPVAVNDAASTSDTEPIVVNVIDNDQGEGIRIIQTGVTSGPGVAAITGDSSAIAFEPEEGFAGQVVVAYTIQDVRGTVQGQATGQLVVTIIAPPAVPPAPNAAADNATASVEWLSPASNGSPITAYEVRSDQGQGDNVGLANSYVFTGLQNGVAHRFQVRAQNEAGWSEWSGFSPAVTPDTEPGQPAAPTVEFADGALDVAWSPPPNEGSAITDYRLEIGGAASGVQSVGTQTAFTWSGLANGANYQFRVVAENAAGPSLPSAWSPAEHPLRQPGPPSQPSVEVGDGSLALAWSPGDSGGDPITHYTVELRSSGEQRRADGTSFTWSPLPNGVAQQFRIRAHNRDPDPGEPGAWSAPTIPCGRPAAIGSVTATRGDKQASVAWQAPNDNGCAITGYTVEAEGVGSQGTQATSHVYAPLRNGTAYRFRVYATNSQGNGSPSGWSNPVTPAGPPIGPNQASAEPTGVGENTVSWDTANPNGAAVERYEVSINNGAPISVGNTTTWKHQGLPEGTTYEYKVRACNNVDCGAFSGADTATTWARPSQLAAPSATTSDTSATATWSPPASDGGTPVNGYQATISPGGTSSTQSTSYTWTGLSYGTTYTITVQACNAVGCSDPSPGTQVTPRGAPGQVATPAVSASGNDVSASWNEPATNGDPIQVYDVDINPGGSTQTNGSTRSTTFSDQSYATTYQVTVRACNGVGCGPWSPPGQATTGPVPTTQPPPPPPTNPPAPQRQVTASYYGDAQGQPGCSSSRCSYVRIEGTGFQANTTYTVDCHWDDNPGGYSPTSIRSDSNGRVVDGNACYYGFDKRFWGSVGGVESPHYPPPPP